MAMAVTAVGGMAGVVVALAMALLRRWGLWTRGVTGPPGSALDTRAAGSEGEAGGLTMVAVGRGGSWGRAADNFSC